MRYCPDFSLRIINFFRYALQFGCQWKAILLFDAVCATIEDVALNSPACFCGEIASGVCKNDYDRNSHKQNNEMFPVSWQYEPPLS
jgi:hypothetical protein